LQKDGFVFDGIRTTLGDRVQSSRFRIALYLRKTERSAAIIPDYQTLMRPVLESASSGEVRIGDVVERLADKFGLTPEERAALLPSGKQTTFANRVNWAKSYLKQAGLVEITRRGYFRISDRGRATLADKEAVINTAYLEQFEDFQRFRERTGEAERTSANCYSR